jgi:hypothetical protein
LNNISPDSISDRLKLGVRFVRFAPYNPDKRRISARFMSFDDKPLSGDILMVSPSLNNLRLFILGSILRMAGLRIASLNTL